MRANPLFGRGRFNRDIEPLRVNAEEVNGQQVAALDAVGAALGAFGMLAFSIAVRMLVETSVAAAFVVASVTWLTCRCRSVSCDAACASSHDREKPRRVGQAGQSHFATRMEPQSDGRLIRCRIGGFGK